MESEQSTAAEAVDLWNNVSRLRDEYKLIQRKRELELAEQNAECLEEEASALFTEVAYKMVSSLTVDEGEKFRIGHTDYQLEISVQFHNPTNCKMTLHSPLDTPLPKYCEVTVTFLPRSNKDLPIWRTLKVLPCDGLNTGTFSINEMISEKFTKDSHLFMQIQLSGYTASPVKRPMVESWLPHDDMSIEQERRILADETPDDLNIYERRYRVLMLNIFSDCEFLVGESDPVKFKASKAILAKSSSVFETMFNGNWSGRISEVKDISPKTFKMLLEAVYGCGVRIKSPIEAADLFCAAHKYNVAGLIDYCASQICPTQVDDFFWHALYIAATYWRNDVKNNVLKIVRRDTMSVINHEEFLNIPQDWLVEILQQHVLNIDKEASLLAATVRWAEFQCKHHNEPVTAYNLRSHLEEAIQYIRFNTMNMSEWHPIAAHILRIDEMAFIVANKECRATPYSKHSPSFCPYRTPRQKPDEAT